MISKLAWLKTVVLSLGVFAGVAQAQHHSHRSCRCLSTDPCWPSLNTWNQLNISLSGGLVSVEPPAKPCHGANINAAECQNVHQHWTDGFWRSDQPGAMITMNFEIQSNETWGCQLNASASAPCTQGNLPIYAAKVLSVSDVQKAVQFAAKHNLRLVIKNSGHDYIGRSTAPNAFSIWTHHLTQITLHDAFVPEKTNAKPTTAVTIQTGVRLADMYEAINQRNWVVPGGAAITVAGGGGFIGGGGHSSLSPIFGLAVDNALQFTVVLANGEVVVANDAQNTDLFWALRGGGAGTWGVVVDVTLRAYPGPKIMTKLLYLCVYNDTKTFQSVMTKFIELQPQMSKDGFAGYWFSLQNALAFEYFTYDINKTETVRRLTPFLNYSNTVAGPAKVNTTEYASWGTFWKDTWCPTGTCASDAGNTALLASRLIPLESFSKPTELGDLLVEIINQVSLTGNPMLGHLVAGGEVSRKDPDSVGVNPAWRKALWHLVISGSFAFNATATERNAVAKSLTRLNQKIIDFTPGAGSYLNEADINEPNWQQSFFGTHYDRLKAIKNKVDPNHLFICHHCVGSEDWDESLNCRLH